MKTKDKQALHAMSAEQLKTKLQELRKSLAEDAKARYTRQSKNLRLGKGIRQDIARVLTILRTHELQA